MSEKSALIDELTDMLMECDLFSNFSAAEIQTAARYFGISRIEEGGQVFNEGDAGSFMCIVYSGSISVMKSNQDGHPVNLATVNRGKTFGEMAVLDGERRSACCLAKTDSILLTLSRDSLEKMLDDAPRTAARVIRALAISLSRRLRMADGALVDHHI